MSGALSASSDPLGIVKDPADLQAFEKAAPPSSPSTGYDSTALDTALAKIADRKRKDLFLQWYGAKLQATIAARMAEQAAAPVLAAKDFINALKSVKFNDVSSVKSFRNTYSTYGNQPQPAPVRLGKQDNMAFFFVPGTGAAYLAKDPKEQGVQHPCFVQITDRDNKLKGLIRLGMYLGPVLTCNGTITDAEAMIKAAIETPLQVFVNPEDRSIWAILTRGGDDYYGVDEFSSAVGDKPDGWKAIGLVQSSQRPPFQLIRLYEGKEVEASVGNPNVRNIGGQGQLFTPGVLGTAQDYEFQIYSVSMLAVDTIWKSKPQAARAAQAAA